MPRKFNAGTKACRGCGVFIQTLDNYCLCCGSPLATKGRANINQITRRKERKNTRETSADKVILKDSAETIIAKYDLLSEAERNTAKNAATKKIGDST